MKFLVLLAAALTLMLSGSAVAHAQSASAYDKGPWRAASPTAKDITGDIAIGNLQLDINFSTFPLAQIRPLTADEASAAFDADRDAPGGGYLYRLQVPAEKRFKHHNTLCGTDETQWMATWASGSHLQVGFFSGSKMPVLTLDALNGSSVVCGIYAYAR